MIQHTPEPWYIGIDNENDQDLDFFEIYGTQQAPIVNVLPDFVSEDAECQANAARIVDCVNACAGIADPSAIPDALHALQKLVEWAWEHLRNGEDGFMLERIEKTIAKLIKPKIPTITQSNAGYCDDGELDAAAVERLQNSQMSDEAKARFKRFKKE